MVLTVCRSSGWKMFKVIDCFSNVGPEISNYWQITQQAIKYLDIITIYDQIKYIVGTYSGFYIIIE